MIPITWFLRKDNLWLSKNFNYPDHSFPRVPNKWGVNHLQVLNDIPIFLLVFFFFKEISLQLYRASLGLYTWGAGPFRHASSVVNGRNGCFLRGWCHLVLVQALRKGPAPQVHVFAGDTHVLEDGIWTGASANRCDKTSPEHLDLKTGSLVY